MARPKKENAPAQEVGSIVLPQDNSEILARLAILEARVSELEAKKTAEKAPAPKSTAPSIHKVETYNGEQIPPQDKPPIKDGWSYDDVLFTMKQVAMRLPPNLIENGRHSRENIEAICPFAVTEEMMDDLYAGFRHEV